MTSKIEKKTFTISKKFFWVSLVLALAAFGLIWADRIENAIHDASQGEWGALLSFAALLLGVFVAFSVIFKEMQKNRQQNQPKEKTKMPFVNKE